MSLTWTLSFLSVILSLPMRVESSWSLPSIVSSSRAAVSAARCSSLFFVIAAVVAACFCSSTSATSLAAAVPLVTCCSRTSDSSFVPQSSSCAAQELLPHLQLLSSCRRRRRVLLPFIVFLTPRVLQLGVHQLTSFQVHHTFARLLGGFADDLGTSRGSTDTGCILYLGRDSASVVCLPVLFFLCLGNQSARPPICGRFPCEACRLASRQCSILYFSVIYHVVQLFLFSNWGLEGVPFFTRFFFECCVECYVVLYHQPPLHPDPSFVGLSRYVFSNVLLFRVNPRPKLSVDVSRDDSDVFFVAVRLEVFVHLLDAHCGGRTSIVVVCGRVGGGSGRRCGVHCSCSSVAECSSARRCVHSRMQRVLLQLCFLLDCS